MARRKPIAVASPEAESQAVVWAPSGALTVAQAAALYEEATKALAGGSRALVDLSGVSAVDTAGCQVLLALKRATEREERGFEMSGLADRVVDTMRLLGYDRALGIAGAVAAAAHEVKETQS